ncbi:FYVE, RhoGEF and PH domain-containing protein 6 [Dipodomys spectabilis]|uniref:FYVE, RhoGEF and PH domain-containing protein 6 n=1 Tax=Dipodomys spectabilis TaxID=105255 RepID=UPI001C544EEE|nr:FYVE, RhoGEF and PH domain-containing protein 6 [Dipodomys spectabilis]
MTSAAAEIKKPPLAPKPKIVGANNRSVPPPVAPKPDTVIASAPQRIKKTKPKIAPKPKVLKSSLVNDIGQPPSRRCTVNLEEQKPELPESRDNFSCKNEEEQQGNDSVLPGYSYSSECTRKPGSRENVYVKQLVLEPLKMKEKLENSKFNKPSLTTQSRNKWDSCENCRSPSGVLKASVLGEKLNDISTYQTPTCSSPQKHRSTENPEMNGGHNSNRQCRTEFSNLSSLEKVPAPQNCHPQLPDLQNLKTCQDGSEKSNSCFHSSELAAPENDKRNAFLSSDVVSKKTEVEDFPPLKISLVPHTLKFPTPKPRKNFTARLLRQKCIDTPSESTEEAEGSNNSSSCCTENNLKSNNVHFLHQNVVTIQKQVDKEKPENTSELHNDCSSDSPDIIDSQKAVWHETSSFGEMAPSLDTDSNVPGDCGPVDSCNMSPAVDKGADFIRCSALSLSLPTQVKLKCSEHLPAACSLEVTVSQLQKGSIKKEESSSRIVPKKPQRHSLPAAGLLKKAASEELVEKGSYPSREKNPEKGLESNHLQHLGAQNHGMPSSSYDMPGQPSEKPVWKLPHPILPFYGNPESLKSIIVSSNTEPSISLTKPRAKSLSAVDTIKCSKPYKESPKKNSLKKLLNMKLSISFSKSDIQKFWSKSSQLKDAFPSSVSGKEQKGIESDWHSFMVGEKKRSKPTKAYSADNCSPEAQKKKKSWNQTSAANGLRAESLDDQMLSRESSRQVSNKSVISSCAPEYENVRYYEEIPEYENFPFIMAIQNSLELELQKSSSVEDTDTNVYEVEEPYEATDGQVQLGSRPQHSRSSGASQEVQDDLDLGLGDLPSEEEEVINSSDEDDVSSESSKGELDLLEVKRDEDAGTKNKVCHIAKEIMSSEKVFVDVLKLLHIDFRDAVAHASRQLGKPIIEDRILNQILYYLPQLYELNRDLLKELEERLLNWTEQQRIADIFVKKGPYLKMYSTYIKEFDKNLALLDEQCKKNSGFAAVVREFEMSPRCANLALKHYLLKPVQRIPQYRLLLTDYLNNLLEDSGDYRDTQDALAVVIEVANHANDTMKQGDNFQKLMQIQYSLNGHHEIVQPGRVFLKEGILMKLSRKVMQPRMFFLFNDALLYTTPMQSGIYKLNNMLSLAGMKVRKPTQEGYQNELKIESVERSFILSASSATERDEWLEAISRSIEEYAKKKITFCPSKSLDEADSENKEVSPLGSKAPIWIPDTRATMCMICTSEFTLTWRRHHCRACGKIVCQACSSNKYGLDYLKNQLARVCEQCFQELQKLGHQHSPRIGSPGNHKSPSSALSSVLQSIPPGRRQKKIPAALKEVSANTEDSSMSGYLYRSKGNKKTWKHLWFVIKNKVLYTYAASEDVAALESQPLLGFTVSQVKDENSESKVFQLLHKNMLFYVFKADDAHSAQKWIEAFQEGTIL